MPSHTPNKHNDNVDPGGKIISTVDTVGTVALNPSSAILTTVAKGSAGQVISVHGTVAGTTVVFDNQSAK